MVTLIILLIKAANNTLNIDIDTLIGTCFTGITVEMIFIWMPLLNLNKWYKKMSYFKYLFKTFF